MIDISSNISEVILKITNDLNEINNEDQVARIVAQSMIAEVKERIHVKGEDSNGQQIGEYSNGYLALRSGNYKNSEKTKKGKKINAGVYTDAVIKLDKNTGVFTGTEKVGTKRENYNRGSDTKVILSLTRQMENDFSVIATDKGYGLGYKNDENFKKSQYAENTYDKKIFDLTETEKNQVVKITEFEVNRLING